jgi:plasmid stabilization system protein ParE
MSLPIRLLAEAREELDAGIDWYEEQREGLGDLFLTRVDEALSRIGTFPEMHGRVFGEVRKAVVQRFPYIVLYRIEPSEVVVISVFHTSQDPSIWQRRVQP